MAAIVKRRALSLGTPKAIFSSWLDAMFTGEANGDLLGRTGGAWTNRTLAAVLGDMLTARGQIIRRGSSAPEALAAQTADTFLGGDGTDVTTRTAAQVLTSLGYEAGTFTPTMAYATPGTSSWAYTTQTGIYVKVARFVWIYLFVQATPTIGTGSGNVNVGGLPFTSDANSLFTAGQLNNQWTWPASRTQVYAVLASNTSTILVPQTMGSAQAASNLQASNMTTGGTHTIAISGGYRVAS